MSQHKGDKPVQRLLANLLGFLGMLGFGVAAWLLMSLASLSSQTTPVEQLARERAADTLKVRQTQAAAANVVAVDSKMPVILAKLQAKAAKPSAIAVPGSEAANAAISGKPQPTEPAPADPKAKAAKSAKSAPDKPKSAPAKTGAGKGKAAADKAAPAGKKPKPADSKRKN